MAISKEMLHRAVDVITEANEASERYCYCITIDRRVFDKVQALMFIHDMQDEWRIVKYIPNIDSDEKMEKAISAVEMMEVSDDTL